MMCISVNLIALKLLLIAYYGARGCLLPLLPVHLLKTGFIQEERAFISIVVPCLSVLGPVLFGFLADYFRRRKKVVTTISVLMLCAMVTVLVMIPSVTRPVPRSPKLNLKCKSEGSAIVSENCFDSCNVINRHSGLKRLSLHNCHSQCNQTYPPHLCFHKNENIEESKCLVLNTGSSDSVVNISSFLERYEDMDATCLYPLVHFNNDKEEYINLECELSEECMIVCDVEETGTEAFTDLSCNTDMSKVTLHKWLYIVFAALTDMFLFTTAALLDSVILLLLRRQADSYGIQLMFGLLSVGLFGPICGYLLYSKTGLFGHSELYPPLMACDIMLLIAGGLILSLSGPLEPLYFAVRPKSQPWRLSGALTVGLLLGVLYGGVSGLTEFSLGPPYFIEGVSGAMVGALLVPLTYKLANLCGTAHVVAMSMAMYCIRFVGYLYMDVSWVRLLLGCLESLTLWVPLTSLVLLMDRCTVYWRSVSIGSLHTMHFGFGRAGGLIISHFLSEYFGLKTSLKIFSVVAAILGLSVTLLNYIWLKYCSWEHFKGDDYVPTVNDVDETTVEPSEYTRKAEFN